MAKKRDKLIRYQSLLKMNNVFDYKYSEKQPKKGTWSHIFGNDNPIVLELACGKGDYTLLLAERYPEKNFIGIDIKGARIFMGAQEASKKGRDNICFLRAYIDHLEEYFEEKEISEIWIPFPDPHPTEKGQKKRLTHKKFLDQYKKILTPGALINLKTDSDLLFDFTIDTLQEQHITPKKLLFNIDLTTDQDQTEQDLLSIQTYYEKKHRLQKKKIHFLSFSF